MANRMKSATAVKSIDSAANGDIVTETPKKTSGSISISIPEIVFDSLEFRIYGLTPLELNPFLEESQKKMLAAQQGDKAGKAREKRDPDAEVKAILAARKLETPSKDAQYWVPAKAISDAMATAAMRFTDLSKKEVYGYITIVAPDGTSRVPFRSSKPYTVRAGQGRPMGRTPLLFWHPQFLPWELEFRCYFPPAFISPASLGNLVNYAGQMVGIGSGRKEVGLGQGMFRLKD